jgi:hypothetical protein
MSDHAIDEPEQRDLAGDPVGQATLSFAGPDVHTLKFDHVFAAAVADGEKTLTLRHRPDFDPSPGERLRFETDTGSDIGRAEIVDVEQLTVAAAAQRDFDGHRSYGSLDDLLAELREYYPDATIGPETLLTALHFELVESGD